MTPKEKAGELVEKFANSNQEDYCTDVFEASQQMANIAVNEIIITICECYPSKDKEISFVEYWEEVKKEIYNL